MIQCFFAKGEGKRISAIFNVVSLSLPEEEKICSSVRGQPKRLVLGMDSTWHMQRLPLHQEDTERAQSKPLGFHSVRSGGCQELTWSADLPQAGVRRSVEGSCADIWSVLPGRGGDATLRNLHFAQGCPPLLA